MAVIKQMDERLANMIAAGEVVDRPSSVIKELVENSLDAKATKIDIIIEDNGMKLIKVIDNGVGMDKVDAKMAFFRHATSKINNEFDLERINTLGFRGEALAAILSVSKIELKTKQANNDGILLEYENSKLINESVTPLNNGTEISVKDLFYNTPARFKYIKSEFTERAHIIDIFDRLALANPNVRISLTIDNILVKQTFGNNDYYGLVEQIYGSNIIKDLKYFENEFQKIKIKGYLVDPKINRSRKKDISIFINGRYIKNYTLSQAIIDGYHTFLMKNRYPIAVIHLEMDPILLDVNVHPQKLEVKFVNESILSYHIELFVRETLENKTFSSTNNLSLKETNLNEFNQKFIKEELDLFSNNEKEEVVYQKKLPYLSYVGTLAQTYLIFQNEEGMYLIDQHAAEERIKYEYYANVEHEIIGKQLLVPRELLLHTLELEKLANYKKEFNKIGFSINDKSQITSHPSFILDKDLDEAVEKLIIMIEEKGSISVKTLLDDLAKDKSCKAAIKANDPLSRREIDYLIDTLRKTNNPFHCPHGRPVFIKLSYYEIEKMFKRVVWWRK